MIELREDRLSFTFPGVHEDARLTMGFQRTLRIPDDDGTYALPPGLGLFPLRHVDDCAQAAPPAWVEHGGVLMPMYQSEALWLYLEHAHVRVPYPCAIKVATGKINAVTGGAWRDALSEEPQDYLVTPEQQWLDGYCVGAGVIRQFVAMPLGSGYSAEEQITGGGDHGGIQIIVYPMKAEAYERLLANRPEEPVLQMRSVGAGSGHPAPGMGLALGGRMRQKVYDDPHSFDVWDTQHGSRCFVHIANSLVWASLTGAHPPHPAPTAKAYTDAGLPWFECYDEGKALAGAGPLRDLESVATRGARKGEHPLPENESVVPSHIVKLRAQLQTDQVREWGGSGCLRGGAGRSM